MGLFINGVTPITITIIIRRHTLGLFQVFCFMFHFFLNFKRNFLMFRMLDIDERILT